MADHLAELAEALATDLRPSNLPVDPALVAHRLGVDVQVRLMPLSVHGATPSALRVVVNEALSATAFRFTLAHELAHVLVKRGAVATRSAADEERFADLFAASLLVPEYALPDVLNAEVAAAALRVDASVVRARAERFGRAVSSRAA